MKTISIQLFSFNELSVEAQKKAIEKHYDINVHHGWWEFLYDDFKEQATNEGFDIDRIYFSGFWSQGDGAMFEYSGLDDKLLHDFVDTLDLSPMRKQWILNNIYVSGSGKQRGHYYHNKSCDHSIYWEINNGDLHWTTNFYQWLESFCDDFEEFVINRYDDLCHSLYTSLENEYNYLTSEEAIKETIILNEYEFTSEGKDNISVYNLGA